MQVMPAMTTTAIAATDETDSVWPISRLASARHAGNAIASDAIIIIRLALRGNAAALKVAALNLAGRSFDVINVRTLPKN